MMTIIGVALLLGLVPFAIGVGLALNVAKERGWMRQGKGSASNAFAVMEEVFSPAASQARQVLQEQKRIGQRASTPGDWLDDGSSVAGQFAGKLTVSVNRPDTAVEPGGRPIIADRH